MCEIAPFALQYVGPCEQPDVTACQALYQDVIMDIIRTVFNWTTLIHLQCVTHVQAKGSMLNLAAKSDR
jgi:hypothetical protein